MADDWPDSPQGDYDREKYPPSRGFDYIPVPTGTTESSDIAPPVRGGFRRDAALVGTSALGVPGDIINAGQPAINWIANSLGVPDIGPQIPIPTTEYVRGRFDIAPPVGEEERGADIAGRGIGTAATSALLPGSKFVNALSAGTGAATSGLVEEYFPDSVALQLIAGGLGSVGSAAIARQLLRGGVGNLVGNATGIGGSISREILGRVLGGAISHVTGLPEYLTTELGGLTGFLSHRMGRGIARNMLSWPGLGSTAIGTAAAVPGAVRTSEQNQLWPDSPLGPPIGVP